MSRHFGIPKCQLQKSGRLGSYRQAQAEVVKYRPFANDNQRQTTRAPARGMHWFTSFMKRTFGRDQQPRH